MKNLIVTSDWHLRDDRPRCRPNTENWYEVQEKSIAFVYNVAVEEIADVCICGDIFHYDTVSNKILNMLLKHVFRYPGVNTYILPGQHDMQYHNLQTINATSYGVLQEIINNGNTQLKSMCEVGMAAPFGVEIFEGEENGLYFTHLLCVFADKSMIGMPSRELLDKYPKAKIMFVGDNHRSFIYSNEKSTRYVVAPGCLIRQSYDLNSYSPQICLCTDDRLRLIRNYEDVSYLVQDSHTDKRKVGNESIEAFVESLRGISRKDFSLSFIDNLRKAIEENTLERDCVDFLHEIISEVKK